MIEPLVYFRLVSDSRKKDHLKLRLDNKGQLITKGLRLYGKGVNPKDATYCSPFSDIKIIKEMLPNDVNLIEVEEASIGETLGLSIFRPGMEMPEPPEGMNEARILIMNPFFPDQRIIRKAEKEIRGFRVALAKKEIAVHLTAAVSVNNNSYRAFGANQFTTFERLYFPLSIQEMLKSNLIISFEGADPDSSGLLPELMLKSHEKSRSK